jgi:translation initiation factor 3 subunit G
MGGIRDFRWGDAAEEDDGIEGVLPPTQVIGPDEKGIKIIIEWRKDDEGKRTKVTKTVRVKKQVKKLNPAAIRRRSLKKFGDALSQNASENRTVVSTEEIFLERTRPAGAKQEAEKGADLALLGNASLIVCRTCGKKGDHWTSKCPFKELAASKNFPGAGVSPPTDEDVPGMSSGAGGKGSYVPPSMRGAKGNEGESMKRPGRDDNSIRVTNLSEDTREQDLQELFRPFGNISRIYVAFDRETGLSRGFAFINFVNRDDAIRAINKLDGYGYDNLILRVEWATPRADRS